MENEWVILFFSPADQKASTFKSWWIGNTFEWIPHPFLPHLICLMRTWLDNFMGSAFLRLRDDCSACPRCELPWTCGRAFGLTPAWSCIKRQTFRESSGERYFPTIMSFSVKLILGWFLHLVPVMTHCLTKLSMLDDSKQKYWSEEIQIGASWGPLSLCLRLSHRRSLLMQGIKHPTQRRVENWFSPPLTRRRLCLCAWCGEITLQQISSENTYYAVSLCIAFM